jgi:23S rRNA pseudouridine955/2504/2580 synthase
MKKAFKHFIVDKNYKSTRLDRFLKKQDQNLPQSLIEKNIRKKKILVNKLKGKSSQILQEGDLVEVFFENNLKETKQKINTNKIKNLIQKILSILRNV